MDQKKAEEMLTYFRFKATGRFSKKIQKRRMEEADRERNREGYFEMLRATGEWPCFRPSLRSQTPPESLSDVWSIEKLKKLKNMSKRQKKRLKKERKGKCRKVLTSEILSLFFPAGKTVESSDEEGDGEMASGSARDSDSVPVDWMKWMKDWMKDLGLSLPPKVSTEPETVKDVEDSVLAVSLPPAEEVAELSIASETANIEDLALGVSLPAAEEEVSTAPESVDDAEELVLRISPAEEVTEMSTASETANNLTESAVVVSLEASTASEIVGDDDPVRARSLEAAEAMISLANTCSPERKAAGSDAAQVGLFSSVLHEPSSSHENDECFLVELLSPDVTKIAHGVESEAWIVKKLTVGSSEKESQMKLGKRKQKQQKTPAVLVQAKKAKENVEQIRIPAESFLEMRSRSISRRSSNDKEELEEVEQVGNRRKFRKSAAEASKQISRLLVGEPEADHKDGRTEESADKAGETETAEKIVPARAHLPLKKRIEFNLSPLTRCPVLPGRDPKVFQPVLENRRSRSVTPDRATGRAKAYHTPGKLDLTCSLCGEELEAWAKVPLGARLLKHAAKHAPPAWKCGVCGDKFVRKDAVARHTKALHAHMPNQQWKDPERVIEAAEELRAVRNVAKECFKNQNLWTSEEKAERVEERIQEYTPRAQQTKQMWAVCNVCKLKIELKNSVHAKHRLKRHAMRHMTAFFKCVVCSELFRRKDNARVHMRKRHPRSRQEPELTIPEAEYNCLNDESMQRCFDRKFLTEYCSDSPLKDEDAFSDAPSPTMTESSLDGSVAPLEMDLNYVDSDDGEIDPVEFISTYDASVATSTVKLDH